MKAIILAAGRGERMRPLTDTCPKPLLKVNGIPLIEHHIKNLAKAGITEIVINHAWLGGQIETYLGDGSQLGVSINYSREGKEALETAGGIINALPLLIHDGSEDTSFLVVNGDVFTSFDFSNVTSLTEHRLAKIWLVKNPEHNSKGDFQLVKGEIKNIKGSKILNSFTYTGIGVFSASFFDTALQEKVQALGPLLRTHADKGNISGEIIDCAWTDVGTPERLAQLNK